MKTSNRHDAFTIAVVFSVGLVAVFGAHLYDRSAKGQQKLQQLRVYEQSKQARQQLEGEIRSKAKAETGAREKTRLLCEGRIRSQMAVPVTASWLARLDDRVVSLSSTRHRMVSSVDYDSSGVELRQYFECEVEGGDVLRFLSKKNDVWFPKLKPVPAMGTEKENHTSWERYYRVSDCSSSSRNNWYLGR